MGARLSMNTHKQIKGATLLSKNQTVGDGFGMFYFRDLYQLKCGKRLSIVKTHPIDCESFRQSGKTLKQALKENFCL